MPVYMIADIKVTDDKWVPSYAASVHELVHKHGGKYLARSGHVQTLEGKPLDTTLIALLAFPSAQAVKAFLSDPKYAPFAAARVCVLRSVSGRDRDAGRDDGRRHPVSHWWTPTY